MQYFHLFSSTSICSIEWMLPFIIDHTASVLKYICMKGALPQLWAWGCSSKHMNSDRQTNVNSKDATGYAECVHLCQTSQRTLGHAQRVATTETMIATTMEDIVKFLHLTFDSAAEDEVAREFWAAFDWRGDDNSLHAFPLSFAKRTAELEAESGWSILTPLVVLDFDFRKVKLCFLLASSLTCVRKLRSAAQSIVVQYLPQSNLDIRQLCVAHNFDTRTIRFLRLLQRIFCSVFKRSCAAHQ